MHCMLLIALSIIPFISSSVFFSLIAAGFLLNILLGKWHLPKPYYINALIVNGRFLYCLWSHFGGSGQIPPSTSSLPPYLMFWLHSVTWQRVPSPLHFRPGSKYTFQARFFLAIVALTLSLHHFVLFALTETAAVPHTVSHVSRIAFFNSAHKL